MLSENLQNISGPVSETGKQRQWYLVVNTPIVLEEWQKFVVPGDSVIVDAIKYRNDLLPCVGLGVTNHDNLTAHLKTLGLEGIQAVDPFHVQMKLDNDKKLDKFQVGTWFSLGLEKFVQRVMKLIPGEAIINSKPLIEAGGIRTSWYKPVGESILTVVMRQDPTKTFLGAHYDNIERVMNMVRGPEYHATRKIENFPKGLLI